MRAIAPQTPFPPNLPAWSPIRHRRFPKIASARNWPNLCVWISWGRFLDGFPCVGFRPLSPLCMKYSFPNNVWSAAYHTQMNPLNTRQLPLNFFFSTLSSFTLFSCFPQAPNPVNTLERIYPGENQFSKKTAQSAIQIYIFLKLSLCQINIDLNTIWTKAMHVRHATEYHHCSTIGNCGK